MLLALGTNLYSLLIEKHCNLVICQILSSMDVNDEALFVEWENDTVFNNFPDDSFLNSYSGNHGSELKNEISPEKKNCYVQMDNIDLDYSTAMSLQKEFNEEVNGNANSNSEKYEASKPLSIVDEQWELIDPHPDIHALFVEYDARFFYGKLKCVEVRWSPRMTLRAGICFYQGRGGSCSVVLSQPLLKLRPRRDLVETLLHYMIHAYLFVTEDNMNRDGHGPEFLSHMYRINIEAGTKITVYHSFDAEANLYKQHWWKCDGPCKSQAPYFGLVKRAMNRAPGPKDNWWATHQLSCGGKYIKIKEPSNFKEKKVPKRQLQSDPKSKPSDIRKFITSTDGKKSNKELKQMNILGIESNILGTQKTSSPNKDSLGVINAIGMPEKKIFIPFQGPGHKLGILSRVSHVSSDISSMFLKNSDLKSRTDFPSSLSRKSDIKGSSYSPGSVLTKKVATSSSIRKTLSKRDAHSSFPKKTKTIEELFSNSRKNVPAQKGYSSSLSRKFETVISPRFAEIQRKPIDSQELQSGLDNVSKASSSKIKLSENSAVKDTLSSQNRSNSDANFSRSVSANLYCPVCCNLVTEEINAHLDKCLKNSTF